MARKVFLSCLGNNDYLECVYCLNSNKSAVVKFVQLALIQFCCADWKENDKILIFTTEEVIAKNWGNLQTELQNLNLALSPENVEIPSGKNETEIWKIFKTMYDQLKEEDELYIDITHGFRSLPLLISSLLQYAKFLKNVSVHAIYYGAFETLGQIADIKQIKEPAERIAPVFELTAFSKIQDWSTAANDFIHFGNVSQLDKLTTDNINPIISQTRGQNQTASDLRKLNDAIKKLCSSIKTCRGQDIIKGEHAKKILGILDSLEQELIPPLNPILKKIKNSVDEIYLKDNEIKNMLLAVKWCIDKQLIQEGLTILEEGIISHVLEQDYLNEQKRMFVSGYLQHPHDFNDSGYKLLAEQKVSLKQQLDALPKFMELCSVFSNIAGLRNDINHAGMKNGPNKAEKIKSNLKELYSKMCNIFGIEERKEK